MDSTNPRLILPNEWFFTKSLAIRLLSLDDCSEGYLGWMRDAEVTQYLETRWVDQSMATIEEFVRQTLKRTDSYLFAIMERQTERHIGNIKIGPIHPLYQYADVSYFIGERTAWGKGYATEAIKKMADLAFQRLGLHRVQAGLYASNLGSAKALQKAGFTQEGVFRSQLIGPSGREDHVWYGLIKSDWAPVAESF